MRLVLITGNVYTVVVDYFSQDIKTFLPPLSTLS